MVNRPVKYEDLYVRVADENGDEHFVPLGVVQPPDPAAGRPKLPGVPPYAAKKYKPGRWAIVDAEGRYMRWMMRAVHGLLTPEQIVAALNAYAAQPEPGDAWRDISEAPKDGRNLLVRFLAKQRDVAHRFATEAFWDRVKGWCFAYNCARLPGDAEHFIHLPPATARRTT